jgi:hypothetical protein
MNEGVKLKTKILPSSADLRVCSSRHRVFAVELGFLQIREDS